MKKKDKKSKKSGSGKTVDFSRHLRGLNKHLEKAKEKSKEKGFEEFDDGRYRMRAVDAKIGVSKNKRVQVVITWKFMDGDYKGKEKLDFEGLQEDHLPYLFKKLDAMEYDVSEIEDLESELQEILDDIKKTKPKCKVRLKTKGEFQNLYVDGLIGDDDEEEESDDEEEDDDSKKKSKKTSKKKKKDDDEDEEDEDESDDDDEEEDDEEEDSDDEDEDEDEDEDSSDDDEDEEDDEEEDKPKKKKKGKKADADEDDEDDEEEDEDEEDDEEDEVDDEIEVVVGSVVKANTKKFGKVKGEVVEVHEADGKILLKTEKGKTVKIKADQILSVEESPAASVPKKKKKSKK